MGVPATAIAITVNKVICLTLRPFTIGAILETIVCALDVDETLSAKAWEVDIRFVVVPACCHACRTAIERGAGVVCLGLSRSREYRKGCQDSC